VDSKSQILKSIENQNEHDKNEFQLKMIKFNKIVNKIDSKKLKEQTLSEKLLSNFENLNKKFEYQQKAISKMFVEDLKYFTQYYRSHEIREKNIKKKMDDVINLLENESDEEKIEKVEK